MPAYQVDVLPRPHRFVVVDAHPIVIEALTSRILSTSPGCEIIYAGNSVRDAVRTALIAGCDCAVVDIDVTGSMSPIEIISAFTMHQIPLVALTGNASPGECEAAMTVGARAYVGKQADPADIGKAISTVLSGHDWLPQETARRDTPARRSVELSAQERRALILYTSGLTQDMVARRMSIAPSTVKHYLDRVREKYSAAGIPARTKLELHALARREGLIS